MKFKLLHNAAGGVTADHYYDTLDEVPAQYRDKVALLHAAFSGDPLRIEGVGDVGASYSDGYLYYVVDL